jgi:aromatic-L-amino-acid decarboxylase
LRRDLANAQRLAALVEQAPDWVLLAPVRLQTLCVRHTPAGNDGDDLDRHTRAWCEAVNSSGAAHLTPALLDDRWMVRVSIGAEPTEWPDIEHLWGIMQQHAGAGGAVGAG